MGGGGPTTNSDEMCEYLGCGSEGSTEDEEIGKQFGDELVQLLGRSFFPYVPWYALPFADCVDGIVEFMGTMGNRMMPNTITRSQYHHWWINVLKPIAHQLVQYKHQKPPPHFHAEPTTRSIDAIIVRIVENFPCQMLGATEIYIIKLIFDLSRETLEAHLARIKERHLHESEPGWYMLDRIIDWPTCKMVHLSSFDIESHPSDFSFDYETDRTKIWSNLYPFIPAE
jgi:hypothetical protein